MGAAGRRGRAVPVRRRRPGAPAPAARRDVRHLARLRSRGASRPPLRLPGPRPVGPARRGCGYNPAKLLLDPYARAVTGALTYDPAVFGHQRESLLDPGDDLVADHRDSAPYVPRSVVVADDDFDWGDEPRPRVAVGGHRHLRAARRGLHRCATRRSREHLRGTYAGLAHPAVVGYLVDLGVTAVELLPVHHFVDRAAPAPQRAEQLLGLQLARLLRPARRLRRRRAAAASRCASSRRWCAPCTRPGIEVILDVVYNHTAEGGRAAPTLASAASTTRVLPARAGRPPLRATTPAAATPSTLAPATCPAADAWTRCATGCEEMHVDGFRFDLASALARGRCTTSTCSSASCRRSPQDPVLREVKLIAEPWDVGPGGYQVGEFPPPVDGVERARTATPSATSGAAATGGVRDLGYRLSGSSRPVRATTGGARTPRSTSSPRTTASPCATSCRYERKHNEANGEDNRDGTDDNRSWNCGVEGETDDPARQRPAPPAAAQPADDAAAVHRRADDRRPATRCGRTQRRQQQRLLPGQRDVLGRLGAARAVAATCTG